MPNSHVKVYVIIDWISGEDPNIIIREAQSSQSDRNSIAYALRLAADMLENQTLEVQHIS